MNERLQGTRYRLGFGLPNGLPYCYNQRTMLRKLAIVLCACGLSLIPGCAKYPSNVGGGTGPQLLVTMTVAGEINPNFYYFVVFNNTGDQAGINGPGPVIAPPWGNGFVAGAATQFVEYHNSLPVDGYELFQFIPGTNLQQYTALGVPNQDTVIQPGASTMEFRIPLSQLATSNIPASSIGSIQINMIATDRLPVNPQDTSAKLFDSFGNSTFGSGQLYDYITINTQQAATYNNSTNPIEPSGDVEQTNGSGGYTNVEEPDLDITNWSVQIVQQ